MFGMVEANRGDSSHSVKLKLDTAGLGRFPMSPNTEEADKDGKGGGGVKLASARTCLGGALISFLSALRRKRQSPNETPHHFPR